MTSKCTQILRHYVRNIFHISKLRDNLLFQTILTGAILFVSFVVLMSDTTNAYAVQFQAFSAITIDQYAVSLNWTPPSGIEIQYYTIKYKESTQTDFIIFADNVSNTDTGITVTGLKKGITYDFRVTAQRSNGVVNSHVVQTTTAKISNPIPTDPPKILGIGFYQIKTLDATDKPESTINRKITKFENFFSYSKFSDTIDQSKYGKSNYEKRGQYFYADEYKTSIPTLLTQTNEAVQIQVRIENQDNPTKIQHLGLFTNIRDKTSDKQFSDTYIIFEKGRPIDVIDPHGFFKIVDMATSIEKKSFWIIFDIIFKKPMEKSDIILESWNEWRIPSSKKILDAWEIKYPQQQVVQDEPSLRTEIKITNNAALPACNQDKSCFLPYEAKVMVGGIVRWINTDSFIHTIVSGSPQNGKDGLFSSKVIMPGKSHQLTFTQVGSYSYYCDIHPWSQGIISVYESEEPLPLSVSYSKPTLVVKSVTSKNSIQIENSDTIYWDNGSLKFEISGYVPDKKSGKHMDLIIKKPDRSKTELKIQTNEKGYYQVPVLLDKKWQSGSYTIIAKYDKNIVGSLSFVIMKKT